MLGYRIISGDSLLISRSFCPQCKTKLKPIDLIPIVSWILLKAQCRYCNKTISFLYPFIEASTAICLTYLFLTSNYFFGYFFFVSALIITIRTDLDTLLISRLFTLYLVPVGFLFSYLKLLPITITQSFLGSIFGFFSLFLVNKVFYFFTKKQGIGEGDFDLLALTGSFTGVLGCIYSIFIGSMLGSIIGITLILLKKKSLQSKLPFGPLLAFGAIIFLLLP